MARTRESIGREEGLSAEIPRLARQARVAHLLRAGSFFGTVGAVVDDLSNGAITKALDKGILDHVDLHIGTGNLNATRLSVAGVYALGGMTQLIIQNRRRAQESTQGVLIALEAQSDRLATAIELSTGQRPIEQAVLSANEQAPIFSQTMEGTE